MLIVALVFFASCAKNGNPTIPGSDSAETPKSSDTSDAGLRMLWGYWKIRGDIRTGEIDIIPNREVAARLNALVFLEPPPLTYLKLAGPVKVNGNEIEFTIALTHPFLGDTEFTAFDVKGILMTQANDARYPGPLVALANEEVTHLMNPDGYTLWWGAHLFPPNGEWPNQGYIDGMLGTPDEIVDFAPGINAYKYFCDDLGPDDDTSLIDPAHRGMFSAGATNKRKYKIKVIGGVFEVNYAVDANWAWPSPVPPINVPEDFPTHANQPEAYRIDVTEVKNTLYHDGTFSGGDLILDITVHTWRDPSTTLAVFMEAPEVLTINFSDEPEETGDGWARYRVEALTCTPQETGSLRVLIGVQTSLMFLVSNFSIYPDDYSCWASYPLTAYFDHHIEVGTIPPADGSTGEIRGINHGTFTPISSLPNYEIMTFTKSDNRYTVSLSDEHIVIPYSGVYALGKKAIGVLESFDGGLSFTAVEFAEYVQGVEIHVFLDYTDMIHLVARDGSTTSTRIRYYNKAIGGEPAGPFLDSALDDRLFYPIGARPFIDGDNILHICYGDYSGPDFPEYPQRMYEITSANYQEFNDPVILIDEINLDDGFFGGLSPVFTFADDGEIFTAFNILDEYIDDIYFSHGFAGSMSSPVKLNGDTPLIHARCPGIAFSGKSTKDCLVIWENEPDDPHQVIEVAPVQGVHIPYGLPPSEPFNLAYNSLALPYFQPSSNGTPYIRIMPLNCEVYYWELKRLSASKLGVLHPDGTISGNLNPYASSPVEKHLHKYIFTDDGIVTLARSSSDSIYDVTLFSPFDKY